jgi:hypothetical protein
MVKGNNNIIQSFKQRLSSAVRGIHVNVTLTYLRCNNIGKTTEEHTELQDKKKREDIN